MQQILFSSYYILITLMASLWVNMAGEVVPGLYIEHVAKRRIVWPGVQDDLQKWPLAHRLQWIIDCTFLLSRSMRTLMSQPLTIFWIIAAALFNMARSGPTFLGWKGLRCTKQNIFIKIFKKLQEAILFCDIAWWHDKNDNVSYLKGTPKFRYNDSCLIED